jgi:ubiquinol oxidase
MSGMVPRGSNTKTLCLNGSGLVSRERRWMFHPPQAVRPEFTREISSKELQRLDIGERKHLRPQNIGDKFAYVAVKGLRAIADIVFYKRLVHRAVVLETVAAIPGMVGGLVRHLRSLRTLKDDGETIRALLAEAENERMHLMTWLQVSRPWFVERAMIMALQGVFFNGYLLLYLFSQRVAHRFVGYLEEQAIVSYTAMIQEIEEGKIPNVPAPAIAMAYWKLKPGSRVLEVARAVRADEAAHRDTNHAMADEGR